MTYKAVIFDMDGLLLDSERLCRECFLEAGRRIGYKTKPEVYLSCIGTNAQRTKTLLIDGHDGDFPYEEINTLWRQLYFTEALEKPIPLKAGAKPLLQSIAESGTPIAMATSTVHEHAQVKLRNAGLEDYFHAVIGGDQVAKSKPDPDIYRKAAGALDVATSDSLAFEDSENGVRAALAAGLTVIQVPDLVAPSPELLAMGHRVLDSLDEFRWSELAD